MEEHTISSMTTTRQRERRIVKTLFEQLRRAPRQSFPVVRKPLVCSRRQGVYLLFDASGEVAHVGRTTRARAGLFQRLRAHLAGRSSFVIGFLKGRRSKLRLGYSFSFIEVEDARLRALVEAYATGVLCPRHIGTGEAVA